MKRRAFLKALHERSPGLREALRADTRVTLAYRGERSEIRSRWDFLAQTGRLMWQSDAFLGHVLYRSKVAMLKRGIPVLPRVAHGLAMATSQICIGDPVVVAPGVYIPHGQIVVDGITEIGPNVILAPWVTIGLRAGNFHGPVIESGVNVGTGAKVIGPVRVGAGSRVGANAVVVDDVPTQATAVGVPARIVVRDDTGTEAARTAGQPATEPTAAEPLVDGYGPDVLHLLLDPEVAAAIRRGDALAAVAATSRLGRDATSRLRLERAARLETFLHVRPVARPDWPPATEDVPTEGSLLPEAPASSLDGDILASAVQRKGSLILRGLVTSAEADALRDEIDTVFEARDRVIAGLPVAADGTYERWPHSEQMTRSRGFVEMDASGVLTADAPRAAATLLRLYERTGLVDAISAYLGERPALSLDKWTLRRVPPESSTGWHQDGAFLGTDVRTVNVWLALTECGVDAPGLDMVPLRLQEIVETGTGDTYFDWGVGHDVVLRTAGENPPVSPVFAAGDAILFDQFNLHRTGVRPGMTSTRYAVEAWFFAPSHFPKHYDGIML